MGETFAAHPVSTRALEPGSPRFTALYIGFVRGPVCVNGTAASPVACIAASESNYS